MYEFWYDYVKKNYCETLLYGYFATMFDTTNFEIDRSLPKWESKKE